MERKCVWKSSDFHNFCNKAGCFSIISHSIYSYWYLCKQFEKLKADPNYYWSKLNKKCNPLNYDHLCGLDFHYSYKLSIEEDAVQHLIWSASCCLWGTVRLPCLMYSSITKIPVCKHRAEASHKAKARTEPVWTGSHDWEWLSGPYSSVTQSDFSCSDCLIAECGELNSEIMQLGISIFMKYVSCMVLWIYFVWIALWLCSSLL